MPRCAERTPLAVSLRPSCRTAGGAQGNLRCRRSVGQGVVALVQFARRLRVADVTKPSGQAARPSLEKENLRPLGIIGIIRPDGKGIASEARRRLDPLFKQAHFASPQFAYIPGRGIADAQLRVIGHAKRVRALLRSRAPDRFRSSKGGTKKPDLIGGFTFSLDLSQAFDKTSREALLRLI